MRTIIKGTPRQAGYTIVGEAANEERAIDMALTLRPDIITRDNILPDMIGTDILKVFATSISKTKIRDFAGRCSYY